MEPVRTGSAAARSVLEAAPRRHVWHMGQVGQTFKTGPHPELPLGD